MDDEMFSELEASLKEGMAILRGEDKPSRTFTFEAPDVKAIRETLKLTQEQFAAMIGISMRTLQNWEQGRRSPEGPARVLLMVAARNPQAVLDTVKAGRMRPAGLWKCQSLPRTRFTKAKIAHSPLATCWTLDQYLGRDTQSCIQLTKHRQGQRPLSV
jgi:putative transcriptional regulator